MIRLEDGTELRTKREIARWLADGSDRLADWAERQGWLDVASRYRDNSLAVLRMGDEPEEPADPRIRQLATLVRSVYGLNAGGAPWEQSDTKKILEDILAGVPSTTSYLQGRALAAWRDEVEREIAAWRADKTAPIVVVPTSPLYAFLTEHDIPPNSGGEGVPWWGDTEPVSASVQEVKEGMMVNGGSVESTGWVVRKLGTLDECLTAQRSLNDDRSWPKWLSDWKTATSRSSQDPGGSSG